jgi:hypothetical protein
MARTRSLYPVECGPERVVRELDRFMAEFSIHPLPGDDWAELAADARWWVDWQTRKRRQWSLLDVWARATGRPEAVRRAIRGAEHFCATKALEFEARAIRYERAAAKRAAGQPVGAQ